MCASSLCLQIGLVLLDEVHLLNESGRGSSLEAGCVCRIKAVAALPEMTGSHLASVRFVAVSATIPNISDVSAHPGCCWVTTGKPLHAYLWPMDMQRHSLAIFAVTYCCHILRQYVKILQPRCRLVFEVTELETCGTQQPVVLSASS